MWKNRLPISSAISVPVAASGRANVAGVIGVTNTGPLLAPSPAASTTREKNSAKPASACR